MLADRTDRFYLQENSVDYNVERSSKSWAVYQLLALGKIYNDKRRAEMW